MCVCVRVRGALLQVLQDNPITVTAFGFVVVGYPVGIADPKYTRSALLFNLCFVFDDSATVVRRHTHTCA